MLETTAYSQRDPSLEVGSEGRLGAAASYGDEVGSRTYRQWTNELQSRIRALQKLEKNWDTHGGLPPSEGSINLALWILSRLGPSYETPEFFPLAGGGLQMEWDSDESEVTVEIRSPNNVSVLVESNQHIEKESVGLLPGKLVVECFDLLSERIPRRST